MYGVAWIEEETREHCTGDTLVFCTTAMSVYCPLKPVAMAYSYSILLLQECHSIIQ